MWPCIVTNFFIIKLTRCTKFTNLFWLETLHVSDSSSVHHQEFIHCTLSNGICHRGLQAAFEQDQDGSARKLFAPELAYSEVEVQHQFLVTCGVIWLYFVGLTLYPLFPRGNGPGIHWTAGSLGPNWRKGRYPLLWGNGIRNQIVRPSNMWPILYSDGDLPCFT